MAPPNDGPVTWDPLKSFSAIGMIGTIPQAIVVNNDVPAHTLQEFVAYARTKSGQVNYGSPAGSGTTPYFTMELFKREQKVNMTHIAYRGQPDVMVDLMRGDLGITSVTAPLVLPNVLNGKMRALALLRRRVWQHCPMCVPSTSRAWPISTSPTGSPCWCSLYLPPDVVAALAKALNDTLASPQNAGQPRRDRPDRANGAARRDAGIRQE